MRIGVVLPAVAEEHGGGGLAREVKRKRTVRAGWTVFEAAGFACGEEVRKAVDGLRDVGYDQAHYAALLSGAGGRRGRDLRRRQFEERRLGGEDGEPTRRQRAWELGLEARKGGRAETLAEFDGGELIGDLGIGLGMGVGECLLELGHGDFGGGRSLESRGEQENRSGKNPHRRCFRNSQESTCN